MWNNINKVGTSETIRALTKKEKEWFAGVIDGDGNFDIRKLNTKNTHLILWFLFIFITKKSEVIIDIFLISEK